MEEAYCGRTKGYRAWGPGRTVGERLTVEGATVEERLKLRRAQLRMEVRLKASSAQQPAQMTGSGRGDEHGAGTGARGGRVAGGKRKATAAGAWEAVRAEKVRREVHWAHVRAAMCAVLHRARRRERGKGQQRKKRTGHTPGTTTSVANEAVVNAEASVVREAKTENRPKRKCKDIPPGTYAPVQRIRGAPPGRSVFDSQLSARPGGSEAAGGREKTKTRKRRGPGGGPCPESYQA